MKTKNILLLGAAILGMGVVACGDDSGTGGAGGVDPSGSTSSTTSGSPTSTASGGTPTSSSSGNNTGGEGGGTGGDPGQGGAGGGTGGEGGSAPPAVPELGPQVERMGRPAINTAANETFVTLQGGLGATTNAIRSASEDAYNEAILGAEDTADFIPTHALQLTVLDGLNGTCGDQPLYGQEEEEEGDCDDPETGPAVLCYAGLGGILNNDQLFLDTAATTCAVYLGVEAGVTNLVPGLSDCGGRRPTDDVIRTTYSLVSGAIDVTDPDIFLLDDGIDVPEENYLDEFPYLGAPHE